LSLRRRARRFPVNFRPIESYLCVQRIPTWRTWLFWPVGPQIGGFCTSNVAAGTHVCGEVLKADDRDPYSQACRALTSNLTRDQGFA
jgi:hypothetical protein